MQAAVHAVMGVMGLFQGKDTVDDRAQVRR